MQELGQWIGGRQQWQQAYGEAHTKSPIPSESATDTACFSSPHNCASHKVAAD